MSMDHAPTFHGLTLPPGFTLPPVPAEVEALGPAALVPWRDLAGLLATLEAVTHMTRKALDALLVTCRTAHATGKSLPEEDDRIARIMNGARQIIQNGAQQILKSE